MQEKERDNRYEALNHAVRHKSRTETAAQIIENAKKYLEFLKGDK